MKIEWLVTDVTAVGSADRADRENLRIILDVFWPVQAAIAVGEPVCGLEIPLIADKTALMSPDRAERHILEMIVDCFWQLRPLLWVRRHFVI